MSTTLFDKREIKLTLVVSILLLLVFTGFDKLVIARRRVQTLFRRFVLFF